MTIEKLNRAKEIIKEIDSIKEILSYEDTDNIIDEIYTASKYTDINDAVVKLIKNMFQEKLSKLEKEFNEL